MASGFDFQHDFEAYSLDKAFLSCFHDAQETDPIQIEAMSKNAQGPGPGSPLAQQLEWHENARRCVADNIASTRVSLRSAEEQRALDDYVRERELDNKIRGLEAMVVQLTRELEEHKRYITILKAKLRDQDAAMQLKDQENADLRERTIQQAATIKHQSQLIQNPRNGLATPSHGQETIAPLNPSYTAPASRYNVPENGSGNAHVNSNRGRSNELPMQSFGNLSTNRKYLNPAEQGSPGPRQTTSGNHGRSRNSSTNTDPYSSTPRLRQTNGTNSRPTTSSTQATSMIDNSMALVIVGDCTVTFGSVTLTKGFEHAYNMVETFARAHVNFVSSEKDGNMPQAVKQALLSAAAPANAFPFMSKPESRYHMVAKLMAIWINKEVLKGISFAGFNAQVDGVIEATRNKIFQGTPAVIKAMYMQDIANHVKGLMNAQGFMEWFQQRCRDKGNELWKLVKPMMHQKTTNDWNDMYALMCDCHKLAVEMILSANEFTFEGVEIQARFNPGNMINKDGTMMGMSGEDLAHRGAVVKLGITPKVLARACSSSGNVSAGLVYPATVLTKWAELRRGLSAHGPK